MVSVISASNYSSLALNVVELLVILNMQSTLKCNNVKDVTNISISILQKKLKQRTHLGPLPTKTKSVCRLFKRTSSLISHVSISISVQVYSITISEEMRRILKANMTVTLISEVCNLKERKRPGPQRRTRKARSILASHLTEKASREY